MVKRIVLILMTVLILVGLGVLLSPMVIGHHIKNNYAQLVGKLFPNQPVQIKLLSYQRGWYTDLATIEVDFSNSGWRVNGQSKITLQQNIDVGPILRQPNGGYMWQLARITTTYQQGKTSYQGLVLIDLHNTLIADNTLTEVTFSKESKSAQLTQVHLSLNAQPETNEIQATLGSIASWGGPSNQNKPSFSATGVHYHKTVTGRQPNADSATAINIDQLSMGDDPQRQIHATDALVQTKTLLQSDSRTVNYRLYAKQLGIGQMPTRTIDLDFTVNNLSQALMNNLTQDIATFLQPGQTSKQPEMMVDLAKVLAHGLTLKINKAFMSTPNGSVLLSGTLTLPASTSLTGLLNPLASLRADLHGKVPLEWLLAEIMSHQSLKSKDQATQQVNDWVKSGLLRLEGQEALFSLTYQYGQYYLRTPDNSKLARFYWIKQPQIDPSHNN